MTEKNKRGRPRKEISAEAWDKLIAMIRIQCTQDEICGVYEMDHKTLDRIIKERGEVNFSQLYKKHGDEGKASLRRAQWKAAQDGNPTLLIWLGKQMLGQADKVHMDNTSSDGSMSPKGSDADALDAINRRLDGLATAGKAKGGSGGD